MECIFFYKCLHIRFHILIIVVAVAAVPVAVAVDAALADAVALGEAVAVGPQSNTVSVAQRIVGSAALAVSFADAVAAVVLPIFESPPLDVV